MDKSKKAYLEFQAELRKDLIKLGNELPKDKSCSVNPLNPPDSCGITGRRYKPFKYLCQQWFWLSVKKASECFFSRRNGYSGKVVFGYSIRLRLFKMEVI